jgi:phage gp29-like protein
MPRLLDRHGQPIEMGQLTEPQSAKLLPITRNFQTHPSRGLTPARLAQILEQAEQGDVLLQLELYEDMVEKDGHLYAELSKRQRALLTVEWSIEPPAGATAAEKQAAQDIEERIRSLDDFEDVILGCAAAIGPAFSCQEIEWQLVGREWMPKCIHFRPHTWFTLDRETRSQILLRVAGAIGEPLVPFGWITHKHHAKPGYIARAGLMRQLVWPYIFKTYAIGDLAEFLEIYGLPLRVGTYPAQATKEEKATLLSAVAALGHDAAGIIPEGMMVDFKEPADGKQEPFMAMIELMERTESKVILGGTLTSQADGKTSTNALGNVHDDVRRDILASDARQIASTLSRDLVYPIGVLNGLIKDPARSPRLRFDTQEEEDFKTMAEGLKMVIVDMGMKVEKRWAYEQLGIPIPAEGEEVIEAPRQAIDDSGAPPPPARGTKPQLRDAARLAALAAAFRHAQGAQFPDQVALDRAIDALDPQALQDQVEGVIAPIIKLITEAESIDQAMSQLATRYPDMDTKRLEAVLERALFVGDVWGMLAAAAEDAAAG